MAIISLYNGNWLNFLMATGCVLYERRTEAEILYEISINFNPQMV